MKITRRQLKQLILEELGNLSDGKISVVGGVTDIMSAAVSSLDWSGAPEYEGMPTEPDDTPDKTWWQSNRPDGVSAQLWDDQRIPAHEALQQAD
jgi:hypothetical protein